MNKSIIGYSPKGLRHGYADYRRARGVGSFYQWNRADSIDKESFVTIVTSEPEMLPYYFESVVDFGCRVMPAVGVVLAIAHFLPF